MFRNASRILAGIVVTVFAVSAFATTMVPANLAQIVEKAEKGFVGTVQSVEVVRAQRGWAEKVTVLVSEGVVGNVKAGDTVVWLQARSGENVRLPGMPEYKAGEEHMIFLAGKAKGSDLQAPMALGQGSFRVHKEKASGQKLARNGFQNANLFDGLDTEAIAVAVVEQQGAGAKLSVAARQKQVQARKGALSGARAGGAHKLEDLTAAAKVMKAQGKPSEVFKGKGDGKRAAVKFE